MSDLTLDALVEDVGEAVRLALAEPGTCAQLGGYVCRTAPCACARDAARAALAAVAKAARVEQVAIDSLEHSEVCNSAQAEACHRVAALLRTLAEAEAAP